MKYVYSLTTAVITCFCLIWISAYPAVAQQFEGVIHYDVLERQTGETGEIVYMIKDTKTRIEFGEGDQQGAMLFLPEESKTVVIIDKMKGYITMQRDSMGDSEYVDQEFTIEKSGETKAIAGRSCEIWVIDNQDEIFNVCMAKGMGSFMMPGNPMAGSRNVPRWAEEAIEEGVMPLEVVRKKDEQSDVQMKATRIEEMDLESSLFEIPDGYKDMSTMMKQMMNRNRN